MVTHSRSALPGPGRVVPTGAVAPGRRAFRGRGRARAGAVVALAVCTLLLAACAKSSDVEKMSTNLQKVAETDRVQNQRLSSLENDVGKQLKQLDDEMRALNGRTTLLEQNTKQMAAEQQTLSDSADRTAADQRKLGHLVSQQVAKMERYRLNTDNELDKMRLQADALQKLLKSPIADLPDKTVADRDLRRAYYHLLDGEFDIAAQAFASWAKKYPKDARVPEATYRQGQAYFLMRRYDHALIPLYELVRKWPKNRLVLPARWMLARSLEETGDLKLAREFYAQLINQDSAYAADATRRVAFINRLYPHSRPAKGAANGNAKGAGKGKSQGKP